MLMMLDMLEMWEMQREFGRTSLELENKNVLKLLSRDVFIANPRGGLHKSEVPQKHAP